MLVDSKFRLTSDWTLSLHLHLSDVLFTSIASKTLEFHSIFIAKHSIDKMIPISKKVSNRLNDEMNEMI